jgi:hypothetical protein
MVSHIIVLYVLKLDLAPTQSNIHVQRNPIV